VLAQRLVRCLCRECREAAAPTGGEASVLKQLGLPPAMHLWRAGGCTACGHSGYRGRTGVYELMLVDEGLRPLIHDRAGEPALRDAVAHAGVRTLAADGARWLADGTTSLAELLRVAGAVAEGNGRKTRAAES